MTTSQPAPAPVIPSISSIAQTPLPIPSRLFVPVQHGDASRVKAPGTRVNRGECLTETTTGDAALALAPATGTIVRVVEVDLPGLARTSAVELEVDYAAEHEAEEDVTNPEPADLPAFIERLRLGGVQANRQTSPDLLAQLNEATRRPIDAVVCSMLDVAGESALCAAITRSSGRDVVAGLMALGKVTGANRVWLAAASNIFNRASAIVRKSVAGSRIKVFGLVNDYPQADPSLLIYTLLGRRLRPGHLPPEVNTLLIDGAAAAAIGRCIARGRPMLEAPVEIRDSAQSRCSVYTVAVGTPLRFVLDAMGLDPLERTLRAGAALRDIRCSPTAVIDGVGELSIDAGPASPSINPDPCIRCGWCVEACPTRINPAGLLQAAQDHDTSEAARYGIEACIECGICSYVCPSRLPLLPAIRGMRAASASPPSARGS
jgi:electron transport complex protein RnfC